MNACLRICWSVGLSAMSLLTIVSNVVCLVRLSAYLLVYLFKWSRLVLSISLILLLDCIYLCLNLPLYITGVSVCLSANESGCLSQSLPLLTALSLAVCLYRLSRSLSVSVFVNKNEHTNTNIMACLSWFLCSLACLLDRSFLCDVPSLCSH